MRGLGLLRAFRGRVWHAVRSDLTGDGTRYSRRRPATADELGADATTGETPVPQTYGGRDTFAGFRLVEALPRSRIHRGELATFVRERPPWSIA